MRTINQTTFGSTAGTPYSLPKQTVAFPSGRRCRSLKQKYVIPTKNNDGSSRDVSLANLLALLAIVVGTFKMAFGFKTEEVVDNQLTFEDLRLLHILATGRDFVILNEAGNPIFLKDYAGDITIGAGATVNLTVFVDRPFYWLALNDDADTWLPGATQMRQLTVEGVRGSGFATGAVVGSYFSQDGSITVEWRTSDVADDNERDEWAPVFRVYKNVNPGLSQRGPEGIGALLAVCDQNAVGASTSVDLFTLKMGDQSIHQNVRAIEVVRDGTLMLPVGAYDANNIATVLYQLGEESKLEDLETGDSLELQQPTAAVAQFKQFTVYVPAMSADRVATYVGPNAVHENSQTDEIVKISMARTLDKPNLAPHLAAVMPASIIPTKSPNFELLAGHVFMRGVAGSEVKVPPSFAPQVAAALSTQPNEEGQKAALAGIARKLTAQIPGGVRAKKGATSALGASVLRQITPPALMGLVDDALNKAAGA